MIGAIHRPQQLCCVTSNPEGGGRLKKGEERREGEDRALSAAIDQVSEAQKPKKAKRDSVSPMLGRQFHTHRTKSLEWANAPPLVNFRRGEQGEEKEGVGVVHAGAGIGSGKCQNHSFGSLSFSPLPFPLAGGGNFFSLPISLLLCCWWLLS